MTPKEIVQKGYDSFAVGDMATIKTLMHDEAIIKVNGMHKFSGTYNGPDDFIQNFLAHIPSHFKNFKVEQLTFDHVIPRSRGGKTTWNNVVTSCRRCNTFKGNKLF